MYGLAIDGDRALFGCRRTDGGSGREIHIYSISGKEDHIIPESRSEGTWGYGDLSGDLVAWTKTDGPLSASATSAEIMVTDLADPSTTAVVHLDRIETPRIQGDTVYWVEKESGDSSEGVIHAYDLQRGESTTLATGVTALCDVRNGYALWMSYSPNALWTTQLPGDAPVATQPATPPHTETAATPPQGSPHTLWLLGAGLVGLLLVSGVAALWRRQE